MHFSHFYYWIFLGISFLITKWDIERFLLNFSHTKSKVLDCKNSLTILHLQFKYNSHMDLLKIRTSPVEIKSSHNLVDSLCRPSGQKKLRHQACDQTKWGLHFSAPSQKGNFSKRNRVWRVPMHQSFSLFPATPSMLFPPSHLYVLGHQLVGDPSYPINFFAHILSPV